MSEHATPQNEGTPKPVIVLLSGEEHGQLKRIAKRERRTLGQQLAYLALQSKEAKQTIELLETAQP